MGAGDQFQKPKFSVPMGIKAEAPWPYDNEPEVSTDRFVSCPVCGETAAPDRTHPDPRDPRSTAKLICFGLRRPR